MLTRATAALLLLLIVAAECRRVRLKPTPAVASKSVAATAASDQEEQPQGITRQVVFYAEPDEQNQQQQQQSDEEQQQPVIIGSRQAYGRSAVGSGQSLPTQHHHRLKPEQHSKSTQQPPVQTIRNFNKLNDDGSFTFGYEAADGSFKEETRGTDCVVRGKYGYVDPDGNKREFTYVSGNPCDPNAISQEEEDNETFKDDDGNNKSNEENIPRNIPSNRRPPPSYALRPIQQQQQQRRPTTTVFQQSYVNSEESAAIASSSGTSEEEQDGQLQLNSAKQPLRPPIYRNNLALTDEEQQTPQVFRPTGRPRLAYHHHHQQPSAAETTRLVRPTAASHIVDNQPATTYRPQIIQLPLVTAAPTALYPKQSARPAYIATPSSTPATYFDEQFKKYQLETNLIPSSSPQKTVPPNNNNNNNPIYSTELVYDPNTGQYNTLVYQQIPKAVAAPQEINVRQKLPFVSSTTAASASVSPFSPRTTAFSSTTPVPLYQQQLIQQQQANQVQQSQQLYNLQVKQQQSQRFPLLPQSSGFVKPPSRQPFLATGSGEQQQTFVQRYPPDAKLQSSSDGRYPSFESGSFQQPQPFYYLSPSAVAADGNPSLASGQIEAFLRGHNLSF